MTPQERLDDIKKGNGFSWIQYKPERGSYTIQLNDDGRLILMENCHGYPLIQFICDKDALSLIYMNNNKK